MIKHSIILILILRIQFFEATFDVNMIMLNTDTHIGDLSLNGKHSVMNAGEHSINGWRRWSSLGEKSHSKIILIWRRCYVLFILNTQLSIRFHHCMLPKGILGFLLWLRSWNVRYNLHTNLCD
jgi:hypothetical protein